VNTASLPKRSLATFYQDAFAILEEAQIPFLIGGAFAQSRHTGRDRDTKDLDIILRRDDVPRMLAAFEHAGYHADIPYPHWLAKIHSNAVDADVLDRKVRLCPPEELLWSKAFVQERERFDGADVLHLLHACARTMDWDRLVMRFDRDWPVLFGHVVLFLFAYPDRRSDIPRSVIEDLSGRLQRLEPQPTEHVCYGTLLSREQYLHDVHVLGYEDARLQPRGGMTSRDLDIWTEAINKK
jgi:hypothetical protein